MGGRARCPFCKCHFLAPARAADGSVEVPRLVRRNPFAQSKTTLPAMLLLFVGLVGFLFNGVQTAQSHLDPEEFERQTREFFEGGANQMKAPELLDKIPATLKWWPRVRIASLCLSLVTIAGAIAMLRIRGHGLAILGSVVAMFNVANCCCFAGIVVGGWSMSVLLNPAVREQFNARVRPIE